MQKDTKLLLFSFVLLNLFNWVTAVELRYGLPLILKYVLSVSVFGIIIWYWLKNKSVPRLGGIYYFLIKFFVIWSAFLIILAILEFNDLFYLQRVFGQRFFFIPYILPVIIIFSKFDLNFFGTFFRITAVLILPAIIIQYLIIASGLDRSAWFEQTTRIYIFDVGSSFLLLTAHLTKKKYVSYIIIGYFITYIFLWSVFGRRGMLLEYALLLIMMLVMRLGSPSLKRTDRMKIYFMGIMLVLLLITFGYLVSSTYAFQRGFDRNAFEESRGQVFEDFFTDFNTIQDWLIGRGLLGTVSRSILGSDEAGYIENGFLNILLKGGVLYALPFLIILLRASYLGIYKSKNELTKALALIIVVHVFMMIYFNLPDYSPKYLLTWIAAAACFNTALRNSTNEDVFRVINRL